MAAFMQQSRVTIAVDMDEPLFPYVKTLVDWHNREYGTILRFKDVHTYDLAIVIGITQEQAKARLERFEESDQFKMMSPTKDAFDTLQQLMRSRFSPIVVTGRADRTAETTNKQLQRHYYDIFGAQPAVHYAYGGKKSVTAEPGKMTKAQVCRAYGAGIIIEDMLEHAEACAKEGIAVLLMDRPWNQREKPPFGVNRVYGWPDVAKRLLVPQYAVQW